MLWYFARQMVFVFQVALLVSCVSRNHLDSQGLPADLPAEFLIGVQENESQDPVDRMLAVQKLLELVHEKSKVLQRLEHRR